MDEPVVSMVSLGCAKNLVDSEGVLGAFVERDWLISRRARDAEMILVNTCGFIDEAREESLGVIKEALELKKAGAVRGVVVMGCMVQLMREQLVGRFPDVDAWVGLTAPGAVVDACEEVRSNGGRETLVRLPDPADCTKDLGPRLRITPKHYAYLRISEGCSNRCHYCLIPSIRGPVRSKPADALLVEAKQLIADGARELILIAQDTTNYGADLDGAAGLPTDLPALVRKLRELDDLFWLRLLYTHPAHISDDLIAVLAEGGTVLPYVDLPIQHASDRILEAMGRGIDKAGLRDVIGRIRERVPGAVMRTTVIVGFPGERDADFNELLDFVREIRFDRLGAFAYSREAGTPAAELDEQVPDEVKQERLDAVMTLQQEIATEQSEELVGKEIEVVIDFKGIDGEWAGRTAHDAPDVDGSIRLEGRGLRAGLFARACVTEAYGYDLVGTVI